MKKFLVVLLFASWSGSQLRSQDTFSILAFDSITGEVGAAGASCVDLFAFTGYSNHFICEVFPGVGAIATQAAYIPANQVNARNRMNLGESPTQIINWLQANDVGSSPATRQYGVVRMMVDSVQTAAFTGTNCMNYKNHVIGPNYTIHGNILLGQVVLDSMEAKFNREKGDLACKLMAAMQGAKMVGADTRCASNGSSSLFAFLKVTLPTDTFGNPAFLVSLKTHSGAGIEPIDSLQKLFTAVKTCTVDDTGLNTFTGDASLLMVFPNPSKEELTVTLKSLDWPSLVKTSVYNNLGLLVQEEKVEFRNQSARVNVKALENGSYLLVLQGPDNLRLVKPFVVYR